MTTARADAQAGLAAGFRDVDAAAGAAPFVAYLDTVGSTAAARAYRRRILDALELAAGDHVLDVGCGTGDEVRAMARVVGASGRAVGVDLSEALIREAGARAQGDAPAVELEVADAHALPFADASFSVTRAERTFQHLADPRRALGEMVRVTRAGGRVLVAEPDWQTLVVDGGDQRVTRAVVDFHCESIRHGWIGRQLAGLFRDARLAEIRVSAETMIVPDLALADAVFGLRASARQAAHAGILAETEADQFIAALEHRAATGAFFAAITGFVVVGKAVG
jgi:SAM-dependent methyltransferase